MKQYEPMLLVRNRLGYDRYREKESTVIMAMMIIHLQFFVREVFAQFLRNTLEIFERDLALKIEGPIKNIMEKRKIQRESVNVKGEKIIAGDAHHIKKTRENAKGKCESKRERGNNAKGHSMFIKRTVSSSSNSLKALRISSLESLSS